MLIRLLLIAFLCTCLSNKAYASDSLNMNAFSQIPILEDGRTKPLATFARTQLKTITGRTSFEGASPTEWLAETLFNPAEAIDQKIIYIENDETKTRLSLDPNQDFFSLADLETGLEATHAEIITLLQSNTDDLTKDQIDLLSTHDKAVLWTKLLRSLSMILPLNLEIPEQYAVKNQKLVTFQTLLPVQQRINADLKQIIAQKGENIENYTDLERQIALLSFQIDQIRAGGLNNTIFRILPSTWTDETETPQDWFSPWAIFQNGKGSPVTAAYLRNWQEMALAYRSGNTQAWNTTSTAALTIALENTNANQTRLQTEILYQAIQPYTIVMALYALSTLLLIYSAAAKTPTNRSVPIAYIITAGAILLHIAAILARIYILDRPPVGTLYESVVFVSLICALAGLIGGILYKNTPSALGGTLSALGLLAVAPIMLQGSDSLELLVAVLNTNFWLTTHVLIITAGYGVCIIAALMAHYYMIARWRGQPKPDIALFLTAFGTVLGGIWADQSWGRFWGWDPKENGALLIVLWLIWAQHARLSGHMRELQYNAAIAYLGVIVALSWFGVNLLGVGLHSYGFTSGLAGGLAIFCTTSTAIIATLWLAVRQKEKTA